MVQAKTLANLESDTDSKPYTLAEPFVAAENQINEQDDYKARVKKITTTLNAKESVDKAIENK